MIQNILIINRGIPFVVENFGQCHTIDTKSSLFSGFLEAFIDFSLEISESKIKSINFEDIIISIKFADDLLFIIIANKEDNLEILDKKMSSIIDLFFDTFKDFTEAKTRKMENFKEFRSVLMKNNIVSKICDDERCDYCPTIEEEEMLEKIYDKIEELAKSS
ncbi:MAG: hypothetical protein EAX96_19395 [Candidatus Lokiarchaeota archaeon]|nr:hypothetical protein [Candidatus Lokiarchaeota archaeon]